MSYGSAPSLPEVRSPDLVQRAWCRDGPDLVWVADFAHVLTCEGWRYVSFIQDGFSRRVLGFTVAVSETVELVIRTLVLAVSVRRRSSLDFVADGVMVHCDAGSLYTSLSFTEKLLDLGIAGSVGRAGTAYDNVRIESAIGLYETELVHRWATGWDGREELELATAR